MAISQNFPDIRPSLNLNFARSKTLDPRITFTRASIGTYVGADGLIKYAAADEARFDHDPTTGESLGLLIEESRSNLFTYSENFSDGSWSKSAASVSNVSITNPSGGGTSTKITEDTNGPFQHGLIQYRSGTAGTYTLSVFLKSAERTVAYLQLSNFETAAASITVDLTDGSVTTEPTNADYTYINGYTIPYGNGWYRCILTATKATTTTYNNTVINPHNGVSAAYTGDGVSGIYVWGAQFETGSFPTSYIPTSGSQVTRQPDNASITGTNFTDFYNQTEGTVYADTKMVGVQTGRYDRLWAITNFYVNLEGISLYVAGITGSTYRSSITITNSATEQIGGASVETALTTPQLKSAFAFKQNDCASSYNGQQRFVDNIVDLSTFTTPPDRLLIGQPQRFQGYSCMTVSQLRYYPERLTNSQLQTLTS
jgi:hypothetical protein